MKRTGTPQFIGRFYHALEQKGRLSIPASFRSDLGSPAILTAGLEESLFLLHQDSWHTIMNQASQLSVTKKSHRDWTRYIANNASLVDIDSQGRILIPDHLRDIAHLTKNVVVVGSFDRIEIWNQSTYHSYHESLAQAAADIAESIKDSVHES
jgi:MraZ protein